MTLSVFFRRGSWVALLLLCAQSVGVQAQTTGGMLGTPGSREAAAPAPMAPTAVSPMGIALPKIVGQDQAVPAAQSAAGSSATGVAPAPAAPAPPASPAPAATRPAMAQNEFQRFVSAASGKSLARFGHSLFSGADVPFGAVESTPVPTDYVLGPGDELYIKGWGAVEIEYRAVVDRNGQISIPSVGTMGVAGLKAGEVEAYIRGQIRRVYTNFSLNVTLGQLRGIQIYVVGQAHRPGSYTVSSLSTLVNAVFVSGGPGASGSMRRVELRRGGKTVTTLDLYDFIIHGSQDQDMRLLPGDVIVYRPAGAEVAVLGVLDSPGIYELKPGGETLSDVLGYGAGVRASTNVHRAQLERIDAINAKAPRSVTTLDLAAAGGTLLRDGDIVTLFGVSPQFANAVTLRGNVAAPLRYPYTPGMTISTLIPERDALITPDYYRRKNKLVQFTDARDVTPGKLEREVRNLLDEPNWEYAAIERLDADRLTLQLIPFNLGKAVIGRDPEHDLPLQPGDVVTVFARDDIRSPVGRQTRLVRVEGEVGAPGIYQVQPGDSLRLLVERAGGLTGEAYLFGTEFSRAATRKAQREALADAVRRLEVMLAGQAATQVANLAGTNAQGAAALQASQRELRQTQLNKLKTFKPNGRISLEIDPAAATLNDLPDLPLEDGDLITVPYRPGFVFALGAVDNDNALLWRDGRKVKDYLMLAGIQPEADTDNIFVVRADGSVVNNGNRGYFSKVGDLALMPGDTVVVPDTIDRESFWSMFVRGLKDWSEILYGFGLTAAAINSLAN